MRTWPQACTAAPMPGPASRTRGSSPRASRWAAAARPTGPAPMMATGRVDAVMARLPGTGRGWGASAAVLAGLGLVGCREGASGVLQGRRGVHPGIECDAEGGSAGFGQGVDPALTALDHLL